MIFNASDVKILFLTYKKREEYVIIHVVYLQFCNIISSLGQQNLVLLLGLIPTFSKLLSLYKFFCPV